MHTETLEAEPATEETEPPPIPVFEGKTTATAGLEAKLWEGFVRLWVVAGGMVLGAILALFIGLFSGWISIC